jgi:hypothetical protein
LARCDSARLAAAFFLAASFASTAGRVSSA